jgi:16S rRNA C967 or C1407 C5-methylase (RsmB/RsmF family)
LKKRDDFVIERPMAGLSSITKGFIDKSGFFRSMPQKHDMDGFFAVRLKKDPL